MANRVLRDWTTSELVDELSADAEVFFTRLIMKADDYGSFYANTKLLKSALFPLKELKPAKIQVWIDECVIAGLIFLYSVDGKDYLRIINFNQRLRNMRNAFPHPDSNSPRVAAIVRESPPETKRNETEEETEGESSLRAIDLPFGEGNDVSVSWQEWQQYRKERGKKLTPSTVKKQLQFLAGRAGPEITAIIDQSIKNGWTGLFEIKSNGKGFNKNDRTEFNQNELAIIRDHAAGAGK